MLEHFKTQSPSVAVGLEVQESARVSGRLWQRGLMVAGGASLHYKDLLR